MPTKGLNRLDQQTQILKEARLASILDMIEINSDITLQQLGDMWGVSRERIRQILKKADIVKVPSSKKSKTRPGYCSDGHPLLEIRLRLMRDSSRCFMCNPLRSYQWVDQNTGRIRSNKHRLEITCYTCGTTMISNGVKAMQRTRYDSKRKHPDMKFCSKECQNAVLRTEWGWGSEARKAKSKTSVVHGVCDECGKSVTKTRAKKQYMDDPSVAPQFRTNNMFCSRICFDVKRRKESTKKLRNYIETNTTPPIGEGRWSNGYTFFKGGFMAYGRAAPSRKDRARHLVIRGKIRSEVSKKLTEAMRQELRYRYRTFGR